MAIKSAVKKSAPKVAPAVVAGAMAQLDNETQAAAVRQQFVTFMVADEAFAVEMAPVQEIIRVPEVVSVPLAPACLLGLANLRGKVLPIISLRYLFHLPDKTHDDATRAVVINAGQQPLAFVVDKVTSVIEVDPEAIESASELGGTVDTQCLSGMLKNIGDQPMVMVLHFAELIQQEFAHLSAAHSDERHTVSHADASAKAELDTLQDELQLVSFKAAQQEYAIAIEHVQEIVQMPTHMIHIPHAASHVLGVMTLRQRLLPLVSLRTLFGLPAQAADEQSRVLVVTVGTQAVGLVTDSVSEVLRIAQKEIDRLPALFAREGQCHEISQICRLDGGQRLVSVISTEHLFQHQAVQEAFSSMQSVDPTSHAEDIQQAQFNASNSDPSQEDVQVVIFTLNNEEFGVPIETVQEIVRIPEALTHVPKTPAFVEGVINLRGSVLPVMDQRTRLGMQRVPRNDHQRIMVFMLHGIRTGFIVDTVTEVLKIHAHEIEPAPKLSGEQALLISRVANLEKQQRMIQLIDPQHLLAEPAQQALHEMALAD